MGSEEEVWHGYFYAGGLFIAASFQTLFLAHYFNRMRITGLRIRVALTSAIYRKVRMFGISISPKIKGIKLIFHVVKLCCKYF